MNYRKMIDAPDHIVEMVEEIREEIILKLEDIATETDSTIFISGLHGAICHLFLNYSENPLESFEKFSELCRMVISNNLDKEEGEVERDS